ncbi:MAG: multiheme c-type cytochrome [Pirellulales bacterium]
MRHRFFRMIRNRRTAFLWLICFGVATAVVASSLAEPPAESPPATAEKPAQPTSGATIAAGKVEGHASCIDCHRSEVSAWLASKHASSVFDLLRSKSGDEYAKKMGIRPGDVTHSSMCVNCHGTPRIDAAGRHRTIAGISCESCHNPAGGEDGWLNAHAVYGRKGTRRVQETDEHYAERADRCRKAGQLRSANIYLMAKRCYECHLVGDEKLVNEAKHRSADQGFEVLKEMLGDVRHNFHLDQKQNAMVSTLWTNHRSKKGRTDEERHRVVYVVGQLVAAETILRNAAKAKDPEGDYVIELGELLLSAYDNLADWEFAEDATEMLEDLGGQLADGDLDPDDTSELLEAADKLSGVAKKIAAGELGDVQLPKIAEEQLQKAYRPR